MEQSKDQNLPSNTFADPSMLAASPDQSRAIAEVQGAIVVAQRCPRNENRAFKEIINSCKRPSLAAQAMYSFPRGGQTVTGPSIRLAEVIARNWGNLQYGIREIEAEGDSTKFEAFCWDVQNNVRASRVFSVSHGRWTKKGGFKKAIDPRDIYEIGASSAVRRLRACILEIIPADLIEEAVSQCEKTLAGKSDVPLKDRIRKMVSVFDQIGVSEEMIVKFLKHKIDATTEVELVTLQKIYKSIQDEMSDRSQWFELEEEALKDINGRFQDGQES